MTNIADTPEVTPGQVWADNDPRCAGRTVRVVELDVNARGQQVARVMTLTNTDSDQALIDRHGLAAAGSQVGRDWVPNDRRGKVSVIRVDRMRPTSTGYRLMPNAASAVEIPGQAGAAS
jgi:hypothetical protein